MTAGRFDMSCTRGQVFSSEITVKNPDDDLASLTFWGSRMQVRRSVSSTDVEVELSTDNGRITHDSESAKILLSLSADETSVLPVGEHVYDLELYNTIRAGVLRLVKGKFTVG